MTRQLGLFSAAISCLLISPLLFAASFGAKVEWAKRVSLSVPVSGVVTLVAVEMGQKIKVGQILLTLDQAPFLTELQSAKAARSQAKFNQREADRDLAQTKELYERGLISNVELENAQLKAKRADAARVMARALVKRATYNLSHSRIIAPFDGWVLSREVNVGQSIVTTQQAATLLVVAETNSYIARAEVPGDKIKNLEPGASVDVEVDGMDYKGKVRQLGLEPVRPTTGSDIHYEVGVYFKSGGRLLRAGQKAEISF